MRSPESGPSHEADQEGDYREEFAAFTALTREIELALNLKLPYSDFSEDGDEPAFREISTPDSIQRGVRKFVPIGEHKSATEYTCMVVEVKGTSREPFGKKITVLRLLPAECRKSYRVYEELQIRPKFYMRLSLLRGDGDDLDRQGMRRRSLAEIDFMERPPKYRNRERIAQAGYEFLAYLALGREYHGPRRHDEDLAAQLFDEADYFQSMQAHDAAVREISSSHGVELTPITELDSLEETG